MLIIALSKLKYQSNHNSIILCHEYKYFCRQVVVLHERQASSRRGQNHTILPFRWPYDIPLSEIQNSSHWKPLNSPWRGEVFCKELDNEISVPGCSCITVSVILFSASECARRCSRPTPPSFFRLFSVPRLQQRCCSLCNVISWEYIDSPFENELYRCRLLVVWVPRLPTTMLVVVVVEVSWIPREISFPLSRRCRDFRESS